MKKRMILLSVLLGFVFIISSSYSTGVDCLTSSDCARSGCHNAQTGGPATIQLWDLTTNSLVISPFVYSASHRYRVLLSFDAGTANTTHTTRKFGFSLIDYSRKADGSYLYTSYKTFTDPVTGGVIASSGPSSFYNNFSCPGSEAYNGVSHTQKLQSIYTSGSFHDSVWINWYPTDTTSGGEKIDSVTFYVQYIMTDTANYYKTTGDTTVPGVDIYGTGISFNYTKNPLAIPDVFANTQITTYPNPGSDQLHIIMNGAQTGDYIVNVYDLNGRNVETATMHVTSSNYTDLINMSECTKGIYLVQLQKDGANKTMVVAKE